MAVPPLPLNRPFVLAKAACSLDGYLDDRSPTRRVFSSPEDLQAVDRLRASMDAILVGAETIRRDNPTLMVKDPSARSERGARGISPNPIRITVTRRGDIPADAAFLAKGEGQRLVYAPSSAREALAARLKDKAEVVSYAGEVLSLPWLLEDLKRRGVARLLVEGGPHLLSLFFAAGAVDQFRLAVAPESIGDPQAPSLHTALSALRTSPPGQPQRCAFVPRSVEKLGDTVVAVYEPAGAEHANVTVTAPPLR